MTTALVVVKLTAAVTEVTDVTAAYLFRKPCSGGGEVDSGSDEGDRGPQLSWIRGDSCNFFEPVDIKF